MRFVTPLIAAFTFSLAVAGPALGADTPLRWKLHIQPDLQRANSAGRLVVKPEKGPEQTYWYVVYTISNHHAEPIQLHVHALAETDASDAVHHEGYYPRAMARIQQKFGDDVMDLVALEGHELKPDETVRAAAVFQVYKPETREFDERVDRLTVRFQGYADPVKKTGLEFTTENLELWMFYEKRGDQFDPNRESVRYVGQEEHVVDGDRGARATAGR